ncbi:MAG: DUF3309 family protein [Chthoniobacteraceae bacterium]
MSFSSWSVRCHRGRYSSGWGYYPSGGLGTLLIILIVLAVLGVI